METKPLKTSDLGKAAFFLYRGLILLGCVDSGESGRLFFVFEDVPMRDALEEEWTSGKDMVSASGYFRSLRVCKKKLQEPVT